jgi:nicotinamide riboside transporter PnuC
MIVWIASIVSILGIFLNARKIIWCWPVWIFSNFLWLFHTLDIPRFIHLDIATSLMWFVFLLANFYGAYLWRKERRQQRKNGKN